MPERTDPSPIPPPNTVERWAFEYVLATSLAHKLSPPPVPETWAVTPRAIRLTDPGRPSELEVTPRAAKKRGLTTPRGRAQTLHALFHHELQAAELMAWAILAFPDAPFAFRRQLARIAEDEARHMRLYAAEIARLGHAIGDFAVRDWFWTRVPTAPDPAAFVAVMGLGLESANLEHTRALAAAFRAAGDEEAARVHEIVGREEIAHVRFGVRWFSHFTGGVDFERWRRALPPPLTPLLMRGQPLARDARARAGQPAAFLDELERWTPEPPGC